MHGGTNPGGKKGNKNSLKHGRYTAQRLADRKRAMQARRNIRIMAAFVEETLAALKAQGHGTEEGGDKSAASMNE